MIRNIICGLILFISAYASSQYKTIEVDYTYKMLTENGEEFEFAAKLIDNGENSVFVYPDSIAVNTKLTNYKIYENDAIFHSRKLDEIKLLTPIFNKNFYVLEKNIAKKMAWDINTPQTKEILGYNCKAAKLTFRGRKYIAYYTDDILFGSGPYKFSGLPGLILEISTEEDRFHYIATKIYLSKEKVTIEDPYTKINAKDFLSFKEHKKLFLQKLKQVQNKIQSEETDDTTYEMNDQSMELHE